jgi:hypothetical protein
MITKVALCSEYGPFRFLDRSRVAREDLDPTGRASCIAAAPVKDIDTGILDRKDELSSVFRFDTNFAVCSFGSNYPHQENLRWLSSL